jgi:hypothetical protein
MRPRYGIAMAEWLSKCDQCLYCRPSLLMTVLQINKLALAGRMITDYRHYRRSYKSTS